MKRLILFDIDETMVQSDGAGRRAIMRALAIVFGIKETTTAVSMSGKTDPQIIQEVLFEHGFPERAIDDGLAEVFSLYPDILRQEVERAPNYRLHEGVLPLINSLSANQLACLGLLTGNIEPGARVKLSPFKLNEYFPVGAFGSDSADRLKLPGIAAARAERFFKTSFPPSEIVIVGDSVNDIACARAFGAVSLAVNTGKTTWQELEDEKPDFLLSSLAETKKVLSAIFAGAL